MLDACIVEQGGEEIEWEGAARMYVAHYLAETGFIDPRSGAPSSGMARGLSWSRLSPAPPPRN
jgi:hypothetical protein